MTRYPKYFNYLDTHNTLASKLASHYLYFQKSSSINKEKVCIVNLTLHVLHLALFRAIPMAHDLGYFHENEL